MKQENSTTNELGISHQMSARQVMAEYNQLKLKHGAYGVVSFLMSAMFYFDWLSPNWWDNTVNGGFDFLITQAGVFGIMGWMFSAVITVLIMHSHTTNNKTLRLGAYSLIPLVVLMGIAFNTFTETASTAEKVQDRVTVKSEASVAYRSALGAMNAPSSSITTSKQYQALNKHLGENKAYLVAAIQEGNMGKVDKWQKLVNKRRNELRELKSTFKDEQQAMFDNNRQNLKDAANNENYAQVVVRWIQEKLNLSFVAAALLISFLIILVYEMLGRITGLTRTPCPTISLT